jgi:UDP-N-acetylglucosamine--N-acetylmuramyl-(pentapeptide) pyrophosphoryl-undecaprenol N-acetylglucosamine transferase
VKRIVVTGGGTGGHTGPALAVIDQIRRQDEHKIDILYIGSKSGIEKQRAADLSIPFQSILTGKLRRYFSWQNALDIIRVLIGICQAFILLIRIRPILIFSTGGFVSVPVVIAGWILRRKIIIHEQTNAVGLANVIAGKFADKIALTHRDSIRYFPKDKCVLTGIPIRAELYRGNKQKALNLYGFSDQLPFVFITGGAQGSHLINRIVKEVLSDLLNHCQILHQCGTGTSSTPSDEADLQAAKSKLPANLQKRYQIVQFIGQELPDVFAACDLIIGRSGAGTVNEAIALQNPAIFIPLKIATKDEQYLNAKVMMEAGAAMIIKEDDLNGHSLLQAVTAIFGPENQIETMKHNVKKLASPDAGNKIVELIFSYII